jgi:hypothetical protein
MSDKFEEYRRMADYCAKMSRSAHSMDLRASWLSLAAKWIALLPRREMTENEKFDAMVQDLGTGQEDSSSSH